MAKSELLIIIRSAGERTDACCKSICEQIVGAENVVVIREAPFERALARMCDVAVKRAAKWTLSVDADVLLDVEATRAALRAAENCDPKTFHAQPPIVCNLFGGIRMAGVRIFRTEHLRRFKSLIPPSGAEMRPETFVVNQMQAEGYNTVVLPEVVGIHDFWQYYRDIYRKAFVHGQKHVNRLPVLLPTWKERSLADPTFRIALQGAFDGLTSYGPVVLNPAYHEERATNALKNQGLAEIPAIGVDSFTNLSVSDILQAHDWPVLSAEVREARTPTPSRLQKLRKKLSRAVLGKRQAA